MSSQKAKRNEETENFINEWQKAKKNIRTLAFSLSSSIRGLYMPRGGLRCNHGFVLIDLIFLFYIVSNSVLRQL